MATVHMSDSEVTSNFAGVLEKVRSGVDVIVEQDHQPVAVIRAPVPKGRTISECIALAEAYEKRLGYAPMPDEEFARDVQAGIDGRRDSLEPPNTIRRWNSGCGSGDTPTVTVA